MEQRESDNGPGAIFFTFASGLGWDPNLGLRNRNVTFYFLNSNGWGFS